MQCNPVVIDLSLLVEIDGAKSGNALHLSRSCLNEVDARRNDSAGNRERIESTYFFTLEY